MPAPPPPPRQLRRQPPPPPRPPACGAWPAPTRNLLSSAPHVVSAHRRRGVLRRGEGNAMGTHHAGVLGCVTNGHCIGATGACHLLQFAALLCLVAVHVRVNEFNKLRKCRVRWPHGRCADWAVLTFAKRSSRSSERRDGIRVRHRGHSFFKVRRLCSRQSLQKRCRHCVVVECEACHAAHEVRTHLFDHHWFPHYSAADCAFQEVLHVLFVYLQSIRAKLRGSAAGCAFFYSQANVPTYRVN